MFSSIVNYLYKTNSIPDAPPIPPITLEEELKNFKFKPALGRSKPKIETDEDYEQIRLADLYIKDILKVKLKHIEVPPRVNYWEHRHPVLQELTQKFAVST